MNTNPRFIALTALLHALDGKGWMHEVIDSAPLHKADRALAREIAYGTCRRMRTLEEMARSLTTNGKLRLKRKEKILLLLSLYQRYFMDRIPLYALVNEAMEIGKRVSPRSVLSFLNAFLRNLPPDPPSLPDDLSILYSFPDLLIEDLIRAYGKERTLEILQAENTPPLPFARIVGTTTFMKKEPFLIANDPAYYIQNPTPAALMEHLAKGKQFNTILDLCSSPGGKLLLARDLFLNAELTANDVSEEKVVRIRQNMKKYALNASVTVCDGRDYPNHFLFDLIVIDAPCSNSGVLNKRPEARWRYEQKNKEKICRLQEMLISHAKTLLNPGGEIWYLTCSILPEENERQTERFSPLREILLLPDLEGHDGGYACSFS